MKLTPPAPQHPLRRMRFFVENQDNPKFEKRARYEIFRLNERMVVSIRRRKLVKPVVKSQEVKINEKPGTMPDKQMRKPFLERIISKIKKASQRGN